MTGAGHINPNKAADPGLVYDLGVTDYACYICATLGDHAWIGDARAQLEPGLQEPGHASAAELPDHRGATPADRRRSRTVTNVGPATSAYTVKVRTPTSLVVRVLPTTLVFSMAGEKKTFSVSGGDQQEVVEGSLRWVSDKHVVRSPVVAVVGLGAPHL
uniref:Subtilisin-like protease fibronectin type-III domain-containing protein n=1 Tax=Leersia perrieri TaxID=77586 RepID=A0A0D9WQ58_9ORYZ